MRFAKDFYHQLVLRCDCGELAAMIHGICHKRAWAVRHGKKVSQMDERYLKRAEEQLYGELAAALDIPPELCGRIAERAEGDFRLVRNMMLLLEKAAKAAENFTVDGPMLDTVISARSWRRK